MPRGFRTKKPKVQAAPLTYELSDSVREVADRLIRLFPMKFGWTVNFKIGYLMIFGSRPKAGEGFDVMAKFRKVPPLYHGLTGFDAVVEVHDWAWRDLTPHQMEGLAAHELSHGEMTEKGTLRLVRHDLSEFRFVVRNWGAWMPDIRAFDEQLALFDDAGAPTRAIEGAQEPLTDFRQPVEPIVPAPTRDASDKQVANDVDKRLRKRSRDSGQPPATPLS